MDHREYRVFRSSSRIFQVFRWLFRNTVLLLVIADVDAQIEYAKTSCGGEHLSASPLIASTFARAPYSSAHEHGYRILAHLSRRLLLSGRGAGQWRAKLRARSLARAQDHASRRIRSRSNGRQLGRIKDVLFNGSHFFALATTTTTAPDRASAAPSTTLTRPCHYHHPSVLSLAP